MFKRIRKFFTRIFERQIPEELTWIEDGKVHKRINVNGKTYTIIRLKSYTRRNSNRNNEVASPLGNTSVVENGSSYNIVADNRSSYNDMSINGVNSSIALSCIGIRDSFQIESRPCTVYENQEIIDQYSNSLVFDNVSNASTTSIEYLIPNSKINAINYELLSRVKSAPELYNIS